MVLKAHYITGFLFLTVTKVLYSQNLVVEGDFENYTHCPTKMGNLSKDIVGLKAPTLGSTDYFNMCGAKEMGVPNNFMGTQNAYQGNGYSGLYLLSPNNYREYIQFQLNGTLQSGKTYKVSLQVSLAEESALAIQEMSVLFSSGPLHLDTNLNLSPPRLDRYGISKYNYIALKVDRTIFNSAEWATVEAEFTAKGYEKYLTFGNFKNDKTSKVIQLETHGNAPRLSYYYLDDVQVFAIKKPTYEMNKPFVLNQLQFEFDNFNLTEKAKLEIKKVFLHLKRNHKVRVAIYGHTDDRGSETYNKYLSSRRARAVALYLQQLGLSKDRISWEGMGDKMPLYKSSTTKARNANRRVEFVITKFEDN